ncbi:Cro/CI family transcriptional regulator [Labrys neptuniae]
MGMSHHAPLSQMVAAAVSACGTTAELARRIGVTRQAIRQWKKIPIDKVVSVEGATGIPREILRPDIFRGGERAA